MKKMGLVILPFLVLSAMNSYAVSEPLAKWKSHKDAVCKIVDYSQPGSYHYFACLDHFDKMTDENVNVENALYDICYDSLVEYPTQVLSAVLKSLTNKEVAIESSLSKDEVLAKIIQAYSAN